MASLNEVTLVGNLGRDPEIKQTKGGNPVGNLALATAERKKDRDGNWTEETEWHRVVVFGKTAENCGRYLKKGRQVLVKGRLKTRKWEDKNGNQRSTTEVIAHNVLFLSSDQAGGGRGRDSGRGHSGGGSRGEDRRSSGRNDGGRNDGGNNGYHDDDIPF